MIKFLKALVAGIYEGIIESKKAKANRYIRGF